MSILLSGVLVMSVSSCTNGEEKPSGFDRFKKIYSRVIDIKNKDKSSENSLFEEGSLYGESSENIKQQSTINDAEKSSDYENGNIEKLICFFENVDNRITEKLYNAKDELTNDYKIIHDFIFEKGSIKGCTFDELKTNIKERLLSIYLSIDEKIDNKYPNYKEIIKEKYGNIKDKVKNKLNELKNEIVDKIDEDKYNKINDIKDELVQQTKNDFSEIKKLGGKLKEKIKI